MLSLAASQPDPRARLNLVREYLQAHILRSIQEAGAFASLAFQGGTALRFLHGLRRFSEDLDFALERPAQDRGLEHLAKAVKRDFELSGYSVEATLRTARVVHTAEVKFPRLLHDADLASARGANLMIRLELDTRPPAGAVTEARLITRHFPISFRVHDLSSCMAGKIHALLSRRYTKGRDLFDLSWYLTRPDRPSPNFDLLRNALEQTRWKGPEVGPGTWRGVLLHRVRSLDWPAVLSDVGPFLEDPRDRQLLDREMLLSELGRERP
jgi:predicted nucleotidyltransferase component of viral defense system